MSKDEAKREAIIKQRLHWLEMDRKRREIDIDNLSKVIDHLDNFYNMVPNLLNANNEKFERWFEKLYRIDKRALLFYIVTNKSKLLDGQFEFVKDWYDMRNKEINWEAVERVAGSIRG